MEVVIILGINIGQRFDNRTMNINKWMNSVDTNEKWNTWINKQMNKDIYKWAVKPVKKKYYVR